MTRCAGCKIAADELGYVPNSVARSLKSSRTNQVAFAMADIGNPTYVAMVRAMQPVLKAAGYRLVLHSTDADIADELDVLRRLGERYVDGLIISPLRVTERHLNAFAEARAPVVVIGSVPEGTPVDNVRADSRTGLRLALDHLYALGRRRIGFVNGPLDTVPGAARSRAYADALAALGLPHDPEPGRDRRLLPRGRRRRHAPAARRVPVRTRCMCANDLIALGALDVLRAEGLAVPEDVAVVGIDDTELAPVAWPTLTSVSLGVGRARSPCGRADARPPGGRRAPRPGSSPSSPGWWSAPRRGGVRDDRAAGRRSVGRAARGQVAAGAESVLLLARARPGAALQRRPAAVRDLPLLHRRPRRAATRSSPSWG